MRKYVPHVGLIYAEHNGEFQEVLVPPRNRVSEERKLDSLFGLMTHGKYKQDSLVPQMWGRDRASFESYSV